MNKVYRIVAAITAGKVATYGQVAKLAGLESPRTVGYLLHCNPDPEKIPCHRVVNSQGESAVNYAFGGKQAQIKAIFYNKEIYE